MGKTMAKHRIRRSFQFGIFDLLVLTTIVAVVAVLWRPVQVTTNNAAPWVFGSWYTETGPTLMLFPDGFYGCSTSGAEEMGRGWTLSRHGAPNAFVLSCGMRRFIIRSEWGSGMMDLLNDDGCVQTKLTQAVRFEGLMRDGVPDGTWKIIWPTAMAQPAIASDSLEFRQGQLVDWHRDGRRDLVQLNIIRKEEGLPELGEDSFSEKRVRQAREHND